MVRHSNKDVAIDKEIKKMKMIRINNIDKEAKDKKDLTKVWRDKTETDKDRLEIPSKIQKATKIRQLMKILKIKTKANLEVYQDI